MTEEPQAPEEFIIAVNTLGEVLEQVRTIARRAALSGNPGVSALGVELLDVTDFLKEPAS